MSTPVRSDHSAAPVLVELKPYALGAVVVRQWRWTMLFPLVVAVLTAGLVLILPSRWTSHTAFMVQQTNSDLKMPTGIATLAGQLGIGLGGSVGQSPKFYADLTTNRTILDEVLDRRVSIGKDSTALLAWLELTGNRAQQQDDARRYLLKRIKTDVDRETGVISLDVTLADPAVAAQTAGFIVDALDRFNTLHRQSSARAKREFAERRVAEADSEVRRAEDQLKDFYESNRTFENSPSLRFIERRYTSRLALLNEVWTSLRREYENARIAEVNDTPVLTVVESPSVPLRRSFPRRTVSVLLALLGGLAIGLATAFLREGLLAASSWDDEGRRRFAEARSDTARQLRGFLARRN